MTRDPYTVTDSASVVEAARVMRDQNIGDVIVTTNGGVCGIVTDRDLAVRVVADGLDPETTSINDICQHTVVSITSNASAAEAVEMMRKGAIRRLPVIDDGDLVGVVTLGDLAMERDPKSALADISEAPANN
jgi:CBS domain-containing protein